MDELKVLSEVVQYIKVEMGDETFGIDISYVDNILRMQRITRVPNTPDYIKGVINLRGEIVPIMNLRLKMGLEEVEETKATRIIIVKMDQIGKLGFIVDCVKEVISLEEEQMESIIHDSKDETTHFVNAVGKVGDSIISLLDLNTVVLDKAVREDNA
ncbi:MAG: purine-binding chemotaxis protein CheW [Lachnospiraceae bacterium]|nr:purine-binding chemotaxis protein CheW [Lachnospiraceae bacterium]